MNSKYLHLYGHQTSKRKTEINCIDDGYMCLYCQIFKQSVKDEKLSAKKQLKTKKLSEERISQIRSIVFEESLEYPEEGDRCYVYR